MAVSARQAQLLNQRGRTLYSGSSIKLLSPTNTSVSSIAKTAVTSELNSMISKYNNGEVSNADMKAFLLKMQNNPGLSSTDRIDVASQITNFDSLILKDRLESAYKAAPDNTASQVSAAQALSNYWKQRAAGMQPDTPAYSTAVDNASNYDAKIASISDSMQKTARTNQRYISEQKINQIASGTPEKAQAKADMWKQLYDQAISDGDTTAANQYAANYQQELTNADTLSQKQTDTANKKTLSDYINTTINDYHDGKIDGNTALSQLEEADKFAYSIGDTSAQNRLNSLSLTINREIDKGITYTSVNGLSQKISGGGSSEPMIDANGNIVYSYSGGGSSGGGTSGKSTGTGGGTGVKTLATGNPLAGNGIDPSKPKTFAELDFEYANDQVTLNNALASGVAPDGSAMTPQRYQTLLAALVKVRQAQLGTITTWATDQVNQNGASSKIGKAAITVLDKYQPQYQQETATYNGIQSGQFALTMNVGSNGVPSIGWISKSDAQNKGLVNVNGIYHPTYFNKDTQNKDTGNMLMDVYDTQGRKITYENDPTYGWIPTAAGPITSKLRGDIIAEATRAFETGHSYTPNIMSYQDVINRSMNPGKITIGKTTTMNDKTNNEFTKNPSGIQGLQANVGTAINNVQKTIGDLVKPSAPMPAVPIPVVAPINPTIPDIIKSPVQTSGFPTQPVIQSAPIGTKLTLSTPSPITKMATQTQMKPIAIPAPMKNTPVVNQAQINTTDAALAAQRAKNNQSPLQTIKNIGSKILGFFK